MVTTKLQNAAKGYAYNTTATSAPPVMGLREFVRGGYRTVDEPTLIYDSTHSLVGTFVPGTIDEQFTWSTDDPFWLKEGGR